MKKLLITGFDPFGGETINPSWEAVKGLPDSVGQYRIVKLQVPTEFDRAALVAAAYADELRPDVILCVGQAGGRNGITPEVIGINLQDASAPDNAGKKPVDKPVVPDGPAAYFATVPVKRLVEAVRAREIPCSLSYSAGTYVCNDLFYSLLHRYSGSDVHVGFIHVPYLPEQAKEGVPCLPLDDIISALKCAIETL